MRLINARTLELEEFFGEGVPKYAILSHTWVDGQEVTFQEFLDQKARDKLGWTKIARTVRLALDDELEHVWIDTCCIDKTSSAELTEAINSMMSWYEHSQVCYTYLEDVRSGLGTDQEEEAFRNSRWFTRGWTLQELLAPSKLVFVFADWTRFATRDEMAGLVSSITGIDASFLHTPNGTEEHHEFPGKYTFAALCGSRKAKLNLASIAQRMSWASNRQTTRVEDIAYCLLGIFNINMPLLYGEGPKAFLRLQEQIMMNSDDQSILAWNFKGLERVREEAGDHDETWLWEYNYKPTFAGLFATSPSAFSTCQSIRRINTGKPTLHSLITNKGLRLELPLGQVSDCPYAFLECQDKYAPARIVALPLWLTREGFYVRARLPLKLVDFQLLLNSRPRELYALKHGDYTKRRKKKTGRQYAVLLRNLPKGVEVLRKWGQRGDLGPYRQIILESEDEVDEPTTVALLLGDSSSGKAKSILVVAPRRQETASDSFRLEFCGFVELDGVNDCDLDDADISREMQRQRDNSHGAEDLLGRILGKKSRFPPTMHTADGVYTTSTETQDCFGTTIVFVDISIREKWSNGTRALLRQISSLFRNNMRGHSGLKRAILLLFLTTRAITILVDFLVDLMARKALKAAANPRCMFPLMTSYAFFSAGDIPPFLALALERVRKGSPENSKDWVNTSMLAYFSCRLMGSDMVLREFQKLLASKKL
ncbi:Vegetative incompatibility protein HET-E-1 [Colletotrichum siamense]|nr:Vegetative incompatibility protein HET-E-1 [Colletotrichum siamense]